MNEISEELRCADTTDTEEAVTTSAGCTRPGDKCPHTQVQQEELCEMKLGGTGEMLQGLRAFATLAEDLNLVLSTHVTWAMSPVPGGFDSADLRGHLCPSDTHTENTHTRFRQN